jgi:crotonobetainyl-CoA:carnitine CoA-transferase CaiB-like acyl-CoA transferase
VRLGVAISDLACGMFAFQGLLLALVARGTTGRGQLVDVGLLDATTALLTYQAQRYFVTGEVPERSGNRHMTIAPYDTFDAADGALVLAVGNDAQWQKFCRCLKLDALAADGRFATNAGRTSHYDELRPRIQAAVARRALAGLIDELRVADVPCGAVRSVAEALRDSQTLAREMVATLTHPTIGRLEMLGLPVKLSETPGAIRTAPPRLGEHTTRVLHDDLALDAAAIARLAASGVVRAV